MRVKIAGTLVLCGLAAALSGQQGIVPPSNLSLGQMETYNRLASRLYAPCCWSEPFRMHQSPAADKLRGEVVGFIRAGLNEGQIKDRLAAEYGERILGEPKGLANVVAYAVPGVVLLAGGYFLAVFLRRPRRLPDTPDLGTLPEVPQF